MFPASQPQGLDGEQNCLVEWRRWKAQVVRLFADFDLDYCLSTCNQCHCDDRKRLSYLADWSSCKSCRRCRSSEINSAFDNVVGVVFWSEVITLIPLLLEGKLGSS